MLGPGTGREKTDPSLGSIRGLDRAWRSESAAGETGLESFVQACSLNPDQPVSPGGIALTIGNFDGVHLGHRALISRCRSRVGEDGKVIALAFHPHPMMYLNPDHAPEPIESFAVRADRMMRMGVDRVIELAPTPELLGKSPQAFVDELIDEYRPNVIVEGHDFHFGKRRAGTPVVLKELAGLRGVDVEIVRPVEVALTDQSIVTASSTITRWLLGNGRVRDAGFVLGRPHELVGEVVQGRSARANDWVPDGKHRHGFDAASRWGVRGDCDLAQQHPCRWGGECWVTTDRCKGRIGARRCICLIKVDRRVIAQGS